MDYILPMLLVYLYGSIPFSLLIGFAYGADIRKVGSGNIGGTNLSRVAGKRAFAYSFILDGSKGVMALIIANIFGINPLILFPFALLGHTFSVFIKFKGGKGVATSFGFAFAYAPVPAIFAILVFLLVLKISKYVSLSSIIGTGVFTVITFFYFDQLAPKILAVIVFIGMTYLHRANIKRIYNGTENKVTWI